VAIATYAHIEYPAESTNELLTGTIPDNTSPNPLTLADGERNFAS